MAHNLFYCFRPADVFDASPRMLAPPGHIEIRTMSEYTPATSFSSSTLRHSYPDSTDPSKILSTSSTASTRLSISFHPDDRCTLTLTGGSPQANPVAAYVSSLSYLQAQPKFSISQKCNSGLTSVSVKFPTDVLQFLPLLQDAFLNRPPAQGDETLTSQIELGAGVSVWALLDLLACVAATYARGTACMHERVRGLFQKSLEGQNLSALADLRQVAGYMMCEDVFKAVLEAVLRDLRVAEERQRMRPAEFDRAALRADINRSLIVHAFTSQSTPICERQVLAATPARVASATLSPTPWPISSHSLFAHGLTSLEVTSGLSFAEWTHLAFGLRHMHLRRFSIKLPLSQQRRNVIAAREDPRFALVPGRGPGGAVQVADLDLLATVASTGGLPELEHLGLVDSALHEVCMPSLTILFASLGDSLTSLDLYEAEPVSSRHLSGFEAAMRQTHGHRSTAPWDCFTFLHRLRILAVGRQKSTITKAFKNLRRSESARLRDSSPAPALPGLDALGVIVIDGTAAAHMERMAVMAPQDDEPVEAYGERLFGRDKVGVYFVERKLD